ncbi:MAG: 2-amino-4-hydroxy-6-hydroxymethyldihydropteridine diphosphokinase [Planctomycetota bacterium]|nr:2-amino-4-hydroxy-6-hydroxymethyldihydropteridine diphosphokinase [Planctomycetota bacterium]
MIDCLISFGSNLGDSREIVLNAVQGLASQVDHLKISKLFSTQPIGGPPGQPAFVNGAARFETQMEPADLLGLLHQTETQFGRERRTRWDARKLDLDLLLYGNKIFFTEACEIPHPRMSFRQFVLVPAQSIAPDLMHPVCHATLDDLLSRVTSAQQILIFSSQQRIAIMKGQVGTLPNIKPNIKFFPLPGAGTQIPITKAVSVDSTVQLLVVDLIGQSKENFLFHNQALIKGYRGPLLLLENESLDQMMVELSAAIESMKAI